MEGRLQPRASLVGTKMKKVEEAKETQRIVEERAARAGKAPPPYEILELVGRGNFGRVFKCRHRETQQLVAIKMMDLDRSDYEGGAMNTTQNLDDVTREIQLLQQLRDSKARKYVNFMQEACVVSTELWIVSEYCSGGSVFTLMKPRPRQGLEERFIVPIARELATAIKFIHDAGIIHRDIKAGNVLISEDGRLQVCDFGISSVLESKTSKRSTVVGTPHWMAPELQRVLVNDEKVLYGADVDIWAFGCTVYEMATGTAPNTGIRPEDLGKYSDVPRLEGDRYSDELKSLVEFVLQEHPEDRPSWDDILQHPFLFDTAENYPTSILVELVERYFRWEQEGGQRQSLFHPLLGASGPEPLLPQDEADDDWNFSTSDDFAGRLSQDFSGMSDPFNPELSSLSTSTGLGGFDEPYHIPPFIREAMIKRGKAGLDRLFNPDAAPYRYGERPRSDLALRDYEVPGGANRMTIIDLDAAEPVVGEDLNLDLDAAPTVRTKTTSRIIRELELEEQQEREREEEELTLRQSTDMRRATRDWTFPSMTNDNPSRRTQDWTFPTITEEKTSRRTQDWTFPTANDNNPSRRTQDWTFQSAMEEVPEEQTLRRTSHTTRRRPPKELTLPSLAQRSDESRNRSTRDFTFPRREDPVARNTRDFTFPAREESRDRHTRDFTFPPKDIVPEQQPLYSLQPSPDIVPGRRRPLARTSTEPLGRSNNFFPEQTASAPDSPLRTSMASMIDLDLALPTAIQHTSRPSTSHNTTAQMNGRSISNGNPFDLEDQVQLSQSNNRTSYHTKSQSEPTHTISRLYEGKEGENGVDVSGQEASPQPPPASFPATLPRHSSRRWYQSSVSSNVSLSATEPLGSDDDVGYSDADAGFYSSDVGESATPPPFKIPRYDINALPPGFTLDREGFPVPIPSERGRWDVNFPVPEAVDPELLQHDADPEQLAQALINMSQDLMQGMGVALSVLKGFEPPVVLTEDVEDRGTVRRRTVAPEENENPPML